MKVRLLTNLNIENHHFATGEVVDISDMSGGLLIRKGYAEKDDSDKHEHIHSGDNAIGKHRQRKSALKG